MSELWGGFAEFWRTCVDMISDPMIKHALGTILGALSMAAIVVAVVSIACWMMGLGISPQAQP